MSGHVSAALRKRVRTYFQRCCAYCQTAEALTVVTFEMEHIVLRQAGGPTTFDNLCLACPSRNRFKGARQRASDPDSAAEVPLFHPHQDRWRDHFLWREAATEIDPRTAVGRATVQALRMNRPALVRVRRMWIELGEHPPSHTLEESRSE